MTQRGTGGWLPYAPSRSAASRVFCIPYAGTGASLYRNWPRHHAGVELLPIELPGRETRWAEPAPTTFQDLAAQMIAALIGSLDVPFAFFGHCWSALVGYEVAIQLAREGMPVPDRLFVSSQVAPQHGPMGRMLSMDDEEIANELGSTIVALGGQAHPELLAIYAKVVRSDIELSRRYVVEHPDYAPCPVTAIGWSADDEVTPAQMSGWADCADTEFRTLPGDHRRFIDAPPELMDVLCAGMLGTERAAGG